MHRSKAKSDTLALSWSMLFPSVMTWIYFVAAAGPGSQTNRGVMIAFATGKIIQFAFPALYVFVTERQRLRLTKPDWQSLAFGTAFGLIVGGAAIALYLGVLKDSSNLSHTPDKVLAKLRESGYASVGGFVAVACFYSIGHSLLEEYYWRWFVFGWLRRHIKPWLAGVLASVGFMAHHVIVLAVFFPGIWQFFTMVLPLSLAVAIGGGVWCWLYQRTGSLYAPWISHMLIDASVMVIGYEMVADRLRSSV
jgi:membrane protease YdiL (CAAX protease family)